MSWKFVKGWVYLTALIRGIWLRFKYRNRTMASYSTYAENLSLAATALKLRNESLKGGAIVECGTWRGGVSAGLIEVGGFDRDYYFFDSFEGLPPADEIDGKAAKDYESALSSPGCAASIEEFMQTVSMTGCPKEKIHTYKGFFESTLPEFSPTKIAVLRLDCDWYESTKICLNKFWDHMLPWGLILIDDYGAWEGCTKAVHEFLAKRAAPEPIRYGPMGKAVFLIRKP
jgi:O-methyltransferase